eukprot:6104112-Prymnesium_polylepis.1
MPPVPTASTCGCFALADSCLVFASRQMGAYKWRCIATATVCTWALNVRVLNPLIWPQHTLPPQLRVTSFASVSVISTTCTAQQQKSYSLQWVAFGWFGVTVCGESFTPCSGRASVPPTLHSRHCPAA